MKIREDILEARKSMILTWGSNREIRKLVTYLHDAETVAYMSAGKYANGIGLIVVTNKRVIFLKDGWFSKTYQDFPFFAISSVKLDSRIIFGDVTLMTEGSGAPDGHPAKVTNIWRGNAEKIANLISAQAGHREQSQTILVSATAPSKPSETSTLPVMSAEQKEAYLSGLERLQRLAAGGLLTPDELEASKKRLLSS